jgi:hypothetical protein
VCIDIVDELTPDDASGFAGSEGMVALVGVSGRSNAVAEVAEDTVETS